MDMMDLPTSFTGEQYDRRADVKKTFIAARETVRALPKSREQSVAITQIELAYGHAMAACLVDARPDEV